jgi:hypothetical protein
MARNPWLKIDPAINLAQNSQTGNNIVTGTVGKLFSWAWLLSGVALMFYGLKAMRRFGKLESQLASLLMAPVLTSWIVALGTIGDHRFRLPTMSLSLVLQVIGFVEIRKRIKVIK